ncbi:hypothetical protein JAAARDRAFT_33024 [Jaapia argillacea MUCL 33604]|uniref:Uncharacterized protein n=1 Tax=Jaapia argillacea MUCL 33604 TaxID=933084 RepID=A0A067PXC1_9AGAM|nr:hypothetical protein JAAARDRAFT_33024 [Jaapia argillacea MUCL 33604]
MSRAWGYIPLCAMSRCNDSLTFCLHLYWSSRLPCDQSSSEPCYCASTMCRLGAYYPHSRLLFSCRGAGVTFPSVHIPHYIFFDKYLLDVVTIIDSTSAAPPSSKSRQRSRAVCDRLIGGDHGLTFGAAKPNKPEALRQLMTSP